MQVLRESFMLGSTRYTAFDGQRLLIAGAPFEVAIAVRKALDRDIPGSILIFDDQTGRQVDFDLRGTDEQIAARLKNSNEPQQGDLPRSPGRPKLGVVSREITLLPRHWDWLSHQPGGASATLRRLVDKVRKLEEPKQVVQEAQQASDQFMATMLGNQPGYEDAARALYAGDRARFLTLSDPWPVDLRDHARRLAEPAFDVRGDATLGQTPRDLLRAQFQIAWALVSYHLESLSTEECLWRPATRCLHVTKDGDRWRAEWPENEDYGIGPPSIAWTTWHICFWWTKALDHIQGKTTLAKDDIAWPGSADDVRSAITALRNRWLEVVSDLTESDFQTSNPVSWPIPDSSPATIAAWLNVELMKNAAEIGLVRFLYAAQTADSPKE